MAEIFAERKYPIRLFFMAAIFLLVGKAAHIQLIDKTYAQRGSTAGIDKITKYPARGLIYDRNGELLVNNIPVYDLMVTYKQLDPAMDTTKFCKLLGISKTDFKKRIVKDWRSNRFSKLVPFAFMSKISADTFARFQEHLYEFPGFFPQVRNIRSYPHPNGAHVLGFIREVNEREVRKESSPYRPGDYIGGSGLEKQYEAKLRGDKGAEYVWKDRHGRSLGSYKNNSKDTLPTPGADLITALDVNLQAYGEKLMQNKTGGIVAIEPRSGEILSMISMPTYDPNQLIINSQRGKIYQELLNNPHLPFFDRAVMAEYPPGSIYKTIVALAGLQENVINPNSGFTCNNGYYYAGRTYGCHAHAYPGNIIRGIQHSCNSYFWQTFRRLVDKVDYYKPEEGLREFNDYVYQFGLDKPLGIDFPGEKEGNVPTPEYYDKVYKGGGWKSPTIMSLGIGQGEIQMTTVQMANLAATLANRGYFVTPHLVKGYKNDTARIDNKYRRKHRVAVAREYFDIVVEGMEQVVLAGTARASYVPGLQVCGKTGTAENPHGEDHSVFFAFAPRDNPKIAIAVFIENAGWGGTYAAPIASLMMEKYINGDIKESRKWLEQRMIEADLLTLP